MVVRAVTPERWRRDAVKMTAAQGLRLLGVPSTMVLGLVHLRPSS